MDLAVRPDAVQERLHQDALLAAFARSMAGEPNLQEGLSCVLDCAARLTAAEWVVLGVYPDAPPSGPHRWSEVHQHAGAAARDGLATATVDALLTHGAHCTEPTQGRYGGQPLLAMPIQAGHTRWGVLVLLLPATASGRVSPSAIAALDVLAAHAGGALRNAARIARERRRTARLQLVAKMAEIINRSGSPLLTTLQAAADAIHEVLEYPNVDIPLIDPNDPDVLVIQARGGGYKQIAQADRIPLQQGIMGAAARTRRTLLVNDVQADPRWVRPPVANPSRAELAVPLLKGEQLLGVLNVEGDGPFDELDQLTLEAIARHLALAIDNAALISEQQTLAIQEERQRLAYELHDSVTQALSGISLLAQSLPNAWDKGRSEGLRISTRVAELARLAVAEMRTLLHELSPAQRQHGTQRTSRRALTPVGLDQLKDGGLAVALPRLLEVLVPPQIRVQCDFSGYTMQVIECEQALYRVFQEAASNVVRHSGATQLHLQAQVDARQLIVRLQDNGRGMTGQATDGYGLRSMRQRLQKLGGMLSLRALQPQGLEVLATLKRRDRPPAS